MYNRKISFLLMLVSLLFLMACGTGGTKDGGNSQDGEQAPVTPREEVKEDISAAPPIEATRQFYYAWLADCVNQYEYQAGSLAEANHHITKKAKSLILGALNDQDIIDVFGRDTLLWGPVLELDNIGNDYYVSKNLMFCVYSTDQNKKRTYSVGISGTDMVSPFDWFHEDLNTGTMVPWPYGPGNVSEGSLTGFNLLNGLKDTVSKYPHQQFTLEAILKDANQADPDFSGITIAGHSLGGAMVQVYSSYIFSELAKSSATPNINIAPWVFAGPTAGDLAFANGINATLPLYTSYSNVNDVVPHAWQADKLKKLCDIYDGVTIYYSDLVGAYKIHNDKTLQGVVNFFRERSHAGGSYTDPGQSQNQYSFNMGTHNYEMDWEEYNTMDGVLEGYWHGGEHNSIYPQLNNITKMCNGGTKITEDQFYNFFYYFGELGVQHTTAYSDYFFQGRSAGFKAAVKTATPGAETDWNFFGNADESRIVLEDFLAKVSAFYTSQQNCSCTKVI